MKQKRSVFMGGTGGPHPVVHTQRPSEEWNYGDSYGSSLCPLVPLPRGQGREKGLLPAFSLWATHCALPGPL